MKISTSVARTCKKLLAFVANICSVKNQHVASDTETNIVYATGTHVTGYTPAVTTIYNYNNTNGPAVAGSFSFIPRPGLAKGPKSIELPIAIGTLLPIHLFKISFMKARFLHIFIIPVLITIFSFGISGVNAAIKTWTGGGGNNNWTTGANWGGTAPVAGDDLVFAGTTRLAPANNFPAGTSFASITFNSGAGAFTLSGASITLTGGITNNSATSQTIGIAINIGAVTRTFTGNMSLTGQITGGGGITMSAGDIILNTASTNTIGPITVTSNRLFVFNSINSISGSTISVQNGATIDFGLAAVTLPAADHINLASGACLANRGSGTLTVSTTTVTFPASGTLIFNQDDQATTAINVTGNYPALTGNVNMQLGGSNTTVGTVTLSGIISGGFGINKTLNGTLVLSGLNTYTGTTTVTAGTLKAGVATAGANGAFGNASAVSLANTAGAILDITGFNNTIGSLTGGGASGGNVTLGAATLTVGSDNTSPAAYSGAVSGTGGLTKIGTGALTLSGTNSFTGGATLSAGTLNINNTQALGTTAGTFTISGGTIDNTSGGAITTVNYPLALNGDFTFTGTQNLNLGTGATTLNADRNITITANTLTIGGAIAAPTRSLTKSGAGTLSFGSSAVSLNNLTISAGTLIAPNATGSLSLAGNFTNNGTFTNNNGTVTLGGTTQSISGTSTTFNNLSLSGSGTKTFGITTAIASNLSIGNGVIANLGTFDHTALSLSLGGFGTMSGKWGGTATADHVNTTFFAPTSGIVTITNNTCGVLPTITTTGTIAPVCFNAGAQNASLTYTATNGSPISYSIAWTGIANQPSTPFTFAAGGGTLNTIVIPAGTPAGTYSGIMTIANAGECANTQAVSITVSANPTTASAGSDQTICASSSTLMTANPATIGTGAWSILAGSPNTNTGQFSSTSDPNATFTPTASGTYTLAWTISNSPCTASGDQVVIIVNPLPTIATAATATTVFISTSSQPSSLTYSGTANSPTTYSITWNASPANSFAPVVNALLPASPISITVPANTAAGTYTGTITVTNANTCVSSGNTFTLTVSNPTVTTGAVPSTLCAGATISIPFTSGGTFTGNTYTAQLSNASGGSFVNIPGATLVSDANSGSITATIPAGTGTGTGYLIRVVASSPATIGSNSSAIIINSIPTTNGVTICQGGSGSLTSSTTCISVPSSANNSTLTGTAAGTGTTWSGPTNIFVNDNAYATASITAGLGTTNATTQTLSATNLGFNIPSTATNIFVQVTIDRFANNAAGVTDNTVQLIKGGSQTGTNLASGTAWTTTETPILYGSSISNSWGTTLQPSDVNTSNFGVALLVNLTANLFATRTANVDYITVTVNYTVPGSLNWYTASSGGLLIGSGSPFNPVGVTNSGLANTDNAGTTTYYAECSSVPGCRTPTTYIINALPTVSFSGLASSYCANNGSVILTGNHAPSGSWSNTPGLVDNHNGTATFNPATAGAGGPYSITYSYTDPATNCSNTTAAQTVSVNPVPTAAISGGGTVCLNSPASITFTGANGTAPYTFNYTINSVAQAPLSSGTGNSITITAPTGTGGTFTYSLVSVQDASSTACSQSQSGTAIVSVNNVSGGIITYSGSQTNGTILCFGSSPSTFASNTNGSGLGSISYRWEQSTDNGGTWTTITGVTTSTYAPVANSILGQTQIRRVAISTLNAVACEANSNVISINAPSGPLNATVTKTDLTCSGVNNGTITISNPTGGHGTYQYSFNAGTFGSTSNFTSLAAGSYSLRIRDAGFLTCPVVTLNPALQIISPPVISITAPATVTPTSCFGTTDGTITISATGGTGTLSYTLSGGTLVNPVTQAGNNVFTSLGAGTNYHYTVTDANNCPSASGNAIVTQPPLVVVTTVSNQTYCAAISQAISFSSPQGVSVTYHWTSTVDVGFGTSGNTGNLSFTATNNTSVPITTTVSVTGTLNGCTGNPMTFTVTVNPRPTIVNQTPAAVCSPGSVSLDANSFTGTNIIPTGTTYSWNAPVNANITGLASGSGAPSFTTGTLINTSNAPITVIYTVTPTSGDAGNCVGTDFTVTVVVNPQPFITDQTPAAVCSPGSVTLDAGSFTGSNIIPTGTTYSWNAPVNANITGLASGLNATSFTTGTLTNTSNAPITVIYTVTPTSGDDGNCVGPDFTVTVVVNPQPFITDQTPAAVCSPGSVSLDANSFTGTNIIPTGTTYSWTAPTAAGITGLAAGSGASFTTGTLTNTTNAPITVTYTVTPTSGDAGNCVGPDFTITVSVNPQPFITDQTPVAVCSPGSVSLDANSFTGTNIIPTGTTYSWNAPVNANITGLASGTGAPSFTTGTLINTSNAPITVIYTVTPTSEDAGNCVGTDFTVTVVVNPQPFITDQTPAAICSPGSVTLDAGSFTGSNIIPTGTTYSWNAPVNANITGLASGLNATSFTTGTLTNTSNAPITVTYTVIPTSGDAGACIGNAFTITVTVNPQPFITDQTPAAVCSPGSVSLDANSFTGTNIIPTGTTYSWNAPVNANITGLASGLNVTSFTTGTLTNTSNAPITVIYTVTPTSGDDGNCVGPDFTVTVVVNPQPFITDQTPAAVCSPGSVSLDANSFTGTNIIPTGTTYSWNAPVNANITGLASGSGAPSFTTGTLINTSNAPITVIYTVTPTSGDAGNCVGTDFTVTVVVNPQPFITDQTPAAVCSPGSVTLDAGSFTGSNIIPTGTTYSWNAPVNANITGLASGLNATSFTTGTLTNTSNAPITVIYTVTPTSGDDGNCVGPDFTVTVVVNPQPFITDQTPAAVCSPGSVSLDANSFTGTNIIPTGTTYSWTAPTAAGITGLAAGSGASFTTGTLTNTTNAPITVTYTVTPTSGDAGNCVGPDFTITVSVNPQPFITDQTPVAVCSPGSVTLGAGDFTGINIIPTNTTYSWNAPVNANITGLASGTGAASFTTGTLTNTTNAPITITYTVIPTSGDAGACIGNAFTITVTINPQPFIADQTPAAICSPGSVTLDANSFTGTNIIPTGTTYSWTAPTAAGITGLAAGSGASFTTGTLTNTTNAPITITYTVIPTSGDAGACIGNAFTITVTVNPQPFIADQTPAAICSPGSVSLDANSFTGTNIIPTGTTYSWTAPTAAGITGLAAGSGASFTTGTLTNTTNAPITITYTVTPTSGDAGNCVGPDFTVTVVVNPRPTSTISATTTPICNGSSKSLSITFTGTAPFVYSLNGGTPVTATTNPEIVSVSPTTTTTYTVTSLTDANCVADAGDMSGSVSVTVLPTPTATIAGTTTACLNAAQPVITFTNPMVLPVIVTYTLGNGTTTTTATININAGGIATINAPTTALGTFTYNITSVQYQGTPNCSNAITGQSAVITVYGNATISLVPPVETSSQTVCINFPIDDIVYTIGGGGTGASVTSGGLPAGVTGAYDSGTGLFTITGSPSASAVPGTYNYTVTTTGPCGNQSLSGTITVGAEPTITALPAGSENQSVCMGTAIGAINFAVGGSATGAIVAGLPDGLTGSYAAGIFTISGTPTVFGIFPYTVITTGGPCTNVSISGTITVNANSTIVLSSSVQSAAQTVCTGNAITDITYAIDGGSTGATVTGLPNGVTGVYTATGVNEGVFTISGTPSGPGSTGTFSYTVTTQGPCSNSSLSGTISIGAASTISLSSPSGSDAQAVCNNNAINTIRYAIGGGATGASITGGALPAGVTGVYDSNAGTFTISGTPTVAGNFTYTVTATGPCTNPFLSGTITVNPSPVVNGINNVTYCNNTPGSAISFSSPNTGVTYHWTSTADVGFGLSGNGPVSAFTAANTANSPVTATVSVTATGSGCTGAATTFTVTVNPTPVVSAVSNLNYCAGTLAGAIAFSSPTSGGTVSYSWASDLNVGFGLNGTGNIGAFTATNNSTSPVTATVTVTPVLNGNCNGSPITFTVTVTPNAAGTITGYSSPLCPSQTLQLLTNGVSNGTGAWTSSNPTVATVSSSGLVTTVAAGNTVITYSVTTVCGTSTSAPLSITVNPAGNAGTISGPSSVCVGSSIILSTNGTSGGTWFSSAPNATVDPVTGKVTGVAEGSVTIYYFVTTLSCGSSFTTYPVTVSPSGGSAGTITGTNAICPNAFAFLATSGVPTGTWTSSNPAVAIIYQTVPGAALVQGLTPGTTIITYTVPSSTCGLGSGTSFTLTVNPVGNTGVLSGLTNVCSNSTIILTTHLPAGGIWYSGSPSVATVNSFGVVSGVAQGSATIFYSVSNTCGTSTESLTVNVNPAVTAGSLSGPASVCAGSTINLISSGTAGGSWTSNTPAATVDANGVVLGNFAGTAIITYTVSGTCTANPSASKTIIINAVPLAGTVSDATICNGSSITFTSSGGTSGGTWSSSNTAVATVNPASGVVLGIAPGSALITYSVTSASGCAAAFASGTLTVKPVLNAGSISGGNAVCAGSTLNLSASGNSGGTWTSSDGAIATVDANTGVVSGAGAGSVTITYTLPGNGCGAASASQVVTVNPVPLAGTVSGASTICKGLSTTFSSNGTGGGAWSSSNTAIATVNTASGVITGVAAGTVSITYTVTTGCGTASASANITVQDAGTISSLSGGSSVCVGSATGLITSGTAGGIWSSNAPGIAAISPSGVVTGIAQGVATITYTFTGCGSYQATFTITVNDVPNAGTTDFILNPDGSTPVLCPGSTAPLKNTGGQSGGTWKSSKPAIATVDANGVVTGVSSGFAIISYVVSNSCGSSSAGIIVQVNSLPDAGTISGASAVCAFATINLSSTGNSGGTWTSSNPDVATVNAATGAVTGVTPGTTTIIYTVGDPALCGTSSATHVVTVNPVPYAGTLSNASVCAGQSITLPVNGSVGGAWSSSNTAVATVDASSGVVTGIAAGITTISYTVSTAACGSATAHATVTVNPLPFAGPINGPNTVCVNATITLSSTNNLGAYDAGGTGTAKWSSSSSSIATVTPNTGIVTGVTGGTVTITYTVTTDCGTSSSTYLITVNPLPAAGTISGNLFVCTGSTTALTSSITGGAWSSSNTSVATVNAITGVVTGVGAGGSIITYTVTSPSGCGTAGNTATVTVSDLPDAGIVTGAATLCAGSTAIFSSNGTGGGSWSSNNIAAATVDMATGVVTGVAAGSATITYTVNGTCGSSSKSANITINALPDPGTVSGLSAMCAGATATFTSTGAGGGNWSSNNILVATVNASGVVTAVGAGSADITYTVTNSCGTVPASAGVTVTDLPHAGTVSGTTALCAGVSAAFTSNGDGGGNWSSDNTAVATVDPLTGLVHAEGQGSTLIKYTVTSTGCGSSVASAGITVNALPTAGITNNTGTTVLTCTTPSVSVTATGGSTYSWSGGLGNAASAIITAPGSYTVTVTAAGGCASTANIIITQNTAAPAAAITNNTGTTVLTCATTSISVTATGGGTYSWSGGLGNAAAATITTPGTYTVTVTGANGCTNTASITITQNIIPPTAGITNNTGTNVLTCAATSISVTATGGATYSWSGGLGNAAAATITAPGTYTVTVTSANGCTNTAIINITQNTTPPGTPAVGTITQPTCTVTTGSVVLSGLPATGTWTLTRTPGGTTTTGTGTSATITGLPANTTYTFKVTNSAGCVSVASNNVTISAAPSGPAAPIVGTITQPTCSTPTASVVLNGLPASGTWTLTRTPGGSITGTGTSRTITGLPANTTYTFKVTNASGCTSVASANVVIGAGAVSPSITATNITASTDPHDCSALITLGSNVTITGSPTTIQYRIGYFWWWFSYQIPSTYTFSRGTTPVIVIATNSCGSAYAVFNVTVVDNTPPTITCVPNAIRAVNGSNTKYSVHGHEFDATASDGCGVSSLIYSLSGATVDGFDNNNRSLNNVKLNQGTTTITWRATDVNGNVSTCSSTVTVGHTGSSFPNPPEVPAQSNAKLEMVAAGLTVNAAPNPTSNYFTLSLRSIGTEKIKLAVVDLMGRTIEKITDITPNSTIRIGGTYHPGVYMVQAIQGQQIVVLKLIKEGN